MNNNCCQIVDKVVKDDEEFYYIAEVNDDETDIKEVTQQARDKMSAIRSILPEDIENPIIMNIDPNEQPIAVLGISANLDTKKMYDLADSTIKPEFEQIQNVGLVEIGGARKREIHVELDNDKLRKIIEENLINEEV